MTSTPALDATILPRPVVSGWRMPLVLYAAGGFSGWLAERAFQNYLQLQSVGEAALAVAYSVGFASGSLAVSAVIRKRGIARPLGVFGMAQLAAGLICAAFPYFPSPLLVLAAAALLGASFPLIAHVLEWQRAFAASLAGALAASLAAPSLIMPAIGPRGSLWLSMAAEVAVCAVAISSNPRARAAAPERSPEGRDIRRLLAASFGAGAILLALVVIWTRLAAVALGPSVYASSWVAAAILLGLFAGAVLAGRVPLRTSALFQCAALLLAAQLVLWDRVPGVFRIAPASFYFGELFRLTIAILLLAPPAAVLGLIYPRVLARAHDAYLAGYLNAAHALGCLAGALLAMLVLAPMAGSEVAFKTLVLMSALFWLVFLLREPLGRKRISAAVASGGFILIVLFGRWWNWGALTAGPGPFHTALVPAKDVRYLPASFVLRQEDMHAGFTTVVEQTVVTGEVARTVRTLFTNGIFQGDDNLDPADGSAAAGSQFVHDYGRALVVGLGTGRSAAALRRLGYREISVAEPARAVVEAARECFSGLNEAILADPRVRLYGDDGRSLLAGNRQAAYDLIDVERTGVWVAGATNFYSREFYRLAHSRLRTGGALQQSVELDQTSPRAIASQLATVRVAFPYVNLWYSGGRGMLVAADHPLTEARLPEGVPSPTALLDSGGVSRLLARLHPPINSDGNRWLEYASPRYRSRNSQAARNIEALRWSGRPY